MHGHDYNENDYITQVDDDGDRNVYEHFGIHGWRRPPYSTITESDVALSLCDGSARNFHRIMSDSAVELATVEYEWHGEWWEYESRNNGEWTRTRRIE